MSGGPEPAAGAREEVRVRKSGVTGDGGLPAGGGPLAGVEGEVGGSGRPK
jgi:hypothetical protein